MFLKYKYIIFIKEIFIANLRNLFLDMKHIALIPAYQPDKELIKIISDLTEQNFIVITIDDGSGQAYESLFSSASAKAVVLRHEINQGKGEALKTGMRYIMEQIKEPLSDSHSRCRWSASDSGYSERVRRSRKAS